MEIHRRMQTFHNGPLSRISDDTKCCNLRSFFHQNLDHNFVLEMAIKKRIWSFECRKWEKNKVNRNDQYIYPRVASFRRQQRRIIPPKIKPTLWKSFYCFNRKLWAVIVCLRSIQISNWTRVLFVLTTLPLIYTWNTKATFYDNKILPK